MATFKAGFYNRLCQITQIIFRVSKKPNLFVFADANFANVVPDLMRKIPSTYQVFLASRAVMDSLAGTEGRPFCEVNTFAFFYLSTGDRLSAAFCNPDAFLRGIPSGQVFCYSCLLEGDFGNFKITICAPTVFFTCQRMLVLFWECPLDSWVWSRFTAVSVLRRVPTRHLCGRCVCLFNQEQEN